MALVALIQDVAGEARSFEDVYRFGQALEKCLGGKMNAGNGDRRIMTGE